MYIGGVALLVHELNTLLHSAVLFLLPLQSIVVLQSFCVDLILQIRNIILHQADGSHILRDLLRLLIKFF